MVNVELAVIGGTGVYKAEMLEKPKELEIKTEYGKTNLLTGNYKGRSVAFLARHGSGHSVPPHLVNYRANLQALKNIGVKKVIATAAVGSLNNDMKPGDFVVVDQFLDFTKGRVSTFFDGGAKGLLHVDMTDPYCREVREEIYNTAVKLGLNVHKGGCYVTAEGPRFETPAEIKMYKMLGGDLVGMTSVPEVVLAREAGLCYATVAMVTNFAAGISPTVLSHSEVVEAMQTSSQDVSRLIMSILETISLERGCTCSETATEVR